jgi:ABC-2 type transport system permease protein
LIPIKSDGLTPYIKKGLTLFIKDIRMMVVSFLILPMALAFVYGNMQKDMFEGKNHSLEPIKVNFQYNESSNKGIALKSILSQPEVREFIIVGNKDSEYSVIINDDFKNVEIKGKDQGAEQFIMLKNFVAAIINGFNQYETMQNTVNSLKLNDAEKSRLMNDVFAAMGKSKNESPIRENIIEGYRTLNSTEYYTISMFSFTSLILIVTLAGYFYRETKEGIVRRSLSTPSNKRNYFLDNMTTVFIISLIITTIYIIINRIRGIAFLGNPVYIAVIILAQSILCASVVGFVTAFIKKEMTVNILLNIIFIVPSMFGGVFFYDEIISNKIMQKIMDFVPNALVLNAYKDLSITGSFNAIQGNLLSMIVLSIVLVVLALVKIEHKWEVQ